MLLIGLTGSIGMGKSTVARRCLALGVPVIDADALVHELYAGPAVGPIEAAFPGTTTNGRVDRGLLAAALMREPARFTQLEHIIHPLVVKEEKYRLAAVAASGGPLAVLEVPLLFETGGEKRVDVTIVVSAPPDVQRRRVLARPGMTEEKFEQILKRQMPDADKRRLASFVVDTGTCLSATHAEIDSIIAALQARPEPGTAYEAFWM